MAHKIGILACALVAPELEEVIQQNSWPEVHLLSTRPHCLLENNSIKPNLSLPSLGPDWDLHQIVCSCSPYGDSEEVPHRPITRHHFDNCFQLFLPATYVDHLTRQGAHLVTAPWLQNWKKHLSQMGFDGGQAKQVFQETSRRIIFLDTGLRPAASDECQEFAEYVGLPWEILPTGLDLPTQFLGHLVHEARANRASSDFHGIEMDLQKYRAQSQLISEMQGELSAVLDEGEVIDKIHGIFSMLFSPRKMAVVSWREGKVRYSSPDNLSSEAREILTGFLKKAGMETFQETPDGHGLLFRLGKGLNLRGGIWISDFTFPENRHQYLEQALDMLQTCELVLNRSRRLHGVIPVCSYCHKVRDKQGKWNGFESYISQRSEALISHSLCPDCIQINHPDLAEDILPDS